MTILCIGDSNTYGYDPRSFIGDRYPETVRWTGRIQAADRTVINAGINGMTAARSRSAFAARIRMSQYDLAIVMLGTNDLLMEASAEETAERIEPLLDLLAGTGKPVLLIAPPHLEFGEWVMSDDVLWESEDLAGLYRELAERKGFQFADSGEWEIGLTYDGVHFSAEGHEIFARRLEEILQNQPQ